MQNPIQGLSAPRQGVGWGEDWWASLLTGPLAWGTQDRHSQFPCAYQGLPAQADRRWEGTLWSLLLQGSGYSPAQL